MGYTSEYAQKMMGGTDPSAKKAATGGVNAGSTTPAYKKIDVKAIADKRKDKAAIKRSTTKDY